VEHYLKCLINQEILSVLSSFYHRHFGFIAKIGAKILNNRTNVCFNQKKARTNLIDTQVFHDLYSE